MNDRAAGLYISRKSTIDSHRNRLRRDGTFWFLKQHPWRIGPCETPCRIEPGRPLVIGDHLDQDGCLIAARLAGEWMALTEAGVPIAAAALAAARAAAQYAIADHLEVPAALAFVAVMAADAAPDPARLRSVWSTLAPLHAAGREPLLAANLERIAALWPMLGTAEAMMETGGDIRLLRDPRSDLNGYGCSHRPRPWAVTFASSTASSVSARGYEAADRARLRITATMLVQGDRAAIAVESAAIRKAIGRAFGLGAKAAVVLAASGTDSELLTLALSHLPRAGQPITTILLAPEETGSGVPMAAAGRHFAIDTANGHAVSREAAIEGFRPDTELVSIGLRDDGGRVRAAAAVEADITSAVAAATAAGRRVILHALDLSKTGLLAPGLKPLRQLRARFGDALDIVVDACQLRMAPARVRDYLAVGAVVQITGSKFLTGPPFAGAALLPPAVAARLSLGRLPAGLDAYSGRAEWPEAATAARDLPNLANYGLVLRWRAALAEYRAFATTDDALKTMVLERFAATVAAAMERHEIFALLPVPTLARDDADLGPPGWDDLRSVFAFAVRDPRDPGRFLDPVAARKLYRWLNADCSSAFENPADRKLAALICHIGQPVALVDGTAGARIGWLRVSAGARLISGEPSHRGLGVERRLDREMRDLAAVFDKIALLHTHWAAIGRADPAARYR